MSDTTTRPPVPPGLSQLTWDLFVDCHDRAGSRATMTQPQSDEEALRLIAGMINRMPQPTPSFRCSHRSELALTLRADIDQSWDESVRLVQQMMNRHRNPGGAIVNEDPLGPCNHEEVLNRVLRATLDDTWRNALAEVRRLWELDHPAPVQQTGGGGTPPVPVGLTQMVSAPKPPEFKDETDFEEYRGNFRFYIRSIEPTTPGQIMAALTGIMDAWKGKKKLFIKNMDPEDFMRPSATHPSWAQSTEALIQFAKRHFGTIRSLADAQQEWIRTPDAMRKEKWKTVEEFYLAFQIHLLRVRDRAETEADKPSEREVTRVFIACLPREVLQAAEAQIGAEIHTAAYDTYRNQIARLWYHYQEKAAKAHVGKRFREEDSEDEADVREAKRRFQTTRTTIPGRCQSTWDNAPPNLQGPITVGKWATPEETQSTQARWKRVKDAGVCARCRLPRSRHPLQDTFQAVGPWEGPRVRETRAEEEEELSEREE